MKPKQPKNLTRRLSPLRLMVSFGLLGFLAAGIFGCGEGGISGDGSVGGGSSSGPGPGSGPGGPGGSGRFEQPILFGISPDVFCVGTTITLEGVNFSQNAERNKVSFRGGSTSVQAAVLSLSFPADGNLADGQDSRLTVMAPTGSVSGSVELEVDGVFAGASGYTACPMIYGFGIGPDGEFPALVRGPLGFNPQEGPAEILIHGINFTEITGIELEDSLGNTDNLAAGEFQRRTLTPANGLNTISLSLQGLALGAQSPRSNIFVRLVASNLQSNQVTVPVQVQGDEGRPLGPVINGFYVPNGVRTGPVRLSYSIYDRPVNMSYQMNFEWTVDRGQTWFPATDRDDDPLNDGVQGLLPGYFTFGSPAGLFRSGGALKVFTWDPKNDPNFRNLNDTPGPTGFPAPRTWTVSFRVDADPEVSPGSGSGRTNPGILVESPPMSFFDLEDRPGGESLSDLRRAEFIENFVTNAFEDDDLTDALWGPPFNTGSLDGTLEPTPTPQFGEGTLDLVLGPSEFPPPNLLNEFYRIDTTRMQIFRVQIVEVDREPVENTEQIFPTPSLPNPGQDFGEFHLRTLSIEEVPETDPEGNPVLDEEGNPVMEPILVRTVGNNPLIIKLSGEGLGDDDVVFRHAGLIDANGKKGEDGREAPGEGGAGILGSGAGGRGAELQIGASLADPDVTGLVRAEAGGLSGGGGGETPAAVDPDTNTNSRFTGAPGGGGGSRLRGVDGDPGIPNPLVFRPARGGRGGVPRGTERLNPLVPGSGGGGGGSSVSRITGGAAGSAVVLANGAGGGSGGGAIWIAGSGNMEITGQILVNGGLGGNGTAVERGSGASGAGGGGSGGCIRLQATGTVSASCESLQANGGTAGEADNMNESFGAGDGSPGWIRVETVSGGGPFCTILAAQTSLAARVSESTSSRLTIEVTPGEAERFPEKGVILIGGEFIAYGERDENSFGNLIRGFRDTEIGVHEEGATVSLDASIFPPESWLNEGFVVSPDPIDTGTGLDGDLTLFFIASLDPQTGDLLRDEDGKVLSIWIFDTDKGTLRDPRGALVRTAIFKEEEPGVLHLTRLKIDNGVTLRGEGTRPMVLRVREIADIGGTIDLNGESGGLLVFNTESLFAPAPGRGGAGGPGGGPGGPGGTTLFFEDENGEDTDAKYDNRDPSNIEPIPGQPGDLPFEFPSEFDVTPVPYGNATSEDDLGVMEATRPTGGASLSDTECENQAGQNLCIDTAGGGGGGGNLTAGLSGGSVPPGPAAGSGGSPMPLSNFRFEGDFLRIGGSGGAGGGASAALSDAYVKGQAGQAIFRGAAKYAPGTGGGGGAGMLHLIVEGSLILRRTSRIAANGGDAFQSIDLGGNGGAGAGGVVFIQVKNSFAVEPGARISVFGGKANQPVPNAPGETLPPYEGNIRNGLVFGGLGGDGADGRILFEAPEDSNVLAEGLNENIFSGLTLLNIEESVGGSVPLQLGIGLGDAMFSSNFAFSAPAFIFNEFGQPTGTDAMLLWEGAPESLDFLGAVGTFSGGILDPSGLLDIDFLRFQVRFLSNGITREVPSVRVIQLPYELNP